MKTIENPNVSVKTFQGMITTSQKMIDFFEVLKRVSKTESAVLIRGDSGTGKELVARAIHNLSPRRQQNFSAVNCAMLTPELVNSELFGHIKGSFTGAAADHKGYFEVSNHGTLFLDEVAELPLTAQSRLLRALQERVITRMGSTKTVKVDVRILSATHKALRRETKIGNFREDLMYRLRVVPIFLPKLVERGSDIEVLTWRFIEEFNRLNGRQILKIEQETWDRIQSYDWPGNVRELRNNVEHAFAVGIGETLVVDDLTPELKGESPAGSEISETAELEYRNEERVKIIKALNRTSGNKGAAADILNMSRSTLWRKMKMFNLS